MADEVAIRALDLPFRYLQKKGIPIETLLAGLGVPTKVFFDSTAHIDWAVYVQLLRRITSLLGSTSKLAEIGPTLLQVRSWLPLKLIGRQFAKQEQVYRWVEKRAGPLLFTTFSTSLAEDRGRLRFTFSLGDAFEVSEEFFEINRGVFEALPTVLGYPPARVTMARMGHTTVYDIVLSPNRRIKDLLLGALRRLSTNRVVATGELDRALSELASEHRELQRAHVLIEQQKEQIEAVEELGRTLIKEVEVDRIGATVKDILLQRVRFEAMAFYVRSPDAEGLGLVSFSVDALGAFVPEATWGHGDSEGRRRLVERWAGLSVVELFSEEGQLVGGVLGLPRSDGGTDLSLFNALLPHLTIAAKHGHAFATIRGLNRDLERRVEERTKELVEAQTLLTRSVEKLHESIEARTRLFSNLNHEFRTPLTLILMPLERLISLPELEAHRSRLQSMELNARKLLQLVNGLLDLAASKEGRLRLKLADIDLAQLARRSLAAFEPAAEQIGITLGLDAPKPVTLHASPDAVSRIIDNLVGNAIKYTRPGGRIDLRVEGGADTVRLEVRDTGVGIAPEHHDRIFERFERISEPVVAGATGTGIGLALVRELCAWHGGSIGVVSALGQGSTFEVTLPRRPPPETLARIDRREVQASNDRILRRRDDQGLGLPGEKRASPSLSLTLALGSSPRPPIPEDDGRPTILVVEDNPQVRAQLREVLHSHFRVLEAEGGARALELATGERLDLVVSDLVMPGMNGMQFCAAFKKAPGHEIVPFILLTATNDRAVLVSAIEQGADDFLVKPFNEGELLARVRAQLRIRDLARRLSTERGQGLVGPALGATTP